MQTKILVADDDTISRSMMRRLLTQCGYEVQSASDGFEAVRRLSEDEGPRLLLLDWMMPGLNGPEVCRAIRTKAREAYVYIVLLTSKDSKDDLIAGLEAGADDYLTKPCHLEELKARLRTGERILQLENSLVKAREEMRFRATHDSLTHLLNRPAILHRLDTELERVRRQEIEFAVLLCDVDHFKSVNDTYGHPVGDDVLRQIAHRLKAAVRANDGVGRIGGEEFLLLLHGCTEQGLDALAASICDQIRSAPVLTSVGPLRMSISAGALQISIHDVIVSTDHLLHTVDLALYQAKARGRDRFVKTTFRRDVTAAAYPNRSAPHSRFMPA